MSKERPIPFSPVMVKAILDGAKTQTRRIVKHQPPSDEYQLSTLVSTTGNRKNEGKIHWIKLDGLNVVDGSQPYFRFPFGHIGDKLWVREAWRTSVAVDGRAGSMLETKGGGYGWPVWYEVDGGEVTWRGAEDGGPGFTTKGRYRHARFMPRWASRITLEITGIRVERLNEISLEDIIAEGVTKELLEEMIEARANLQKALPEHWASGGDEGFSYCYKCCTKEVERLEKEDPEGEYHVGGGYGSEGDSIPYCETCHALLSNSLLEGGAETELEHFLEYGANLKSPNDCYSLREALYGIGDDQEKLVHKVAWRLLWDSINGKDETKNWEANPFVWVIEFKRVNQ